MEETILQIREYEAQDQPAFETLNRQWIEKYFKMEPPDYEILQHPDEHILTRGGRIFMAFSNNEPVGTVALKPVSSKTFELTKMAVLESFRGRRIGRALAESAIAWAANSGADKIVLYSNTLLDAAIVLYRNLGFKEIPVDGPYERTNIKMELTITQPFAG